MILGGLCRILRASNGRENLDTIQQSLPLQKKKLCSIIAKCYANHHTKILLFSSTSFQENPFIIQEAVGLSAVLFTTYYSILFVPLEWSLFPEGKIAWNTQSNQQSEINNPQSRMFLFRSAGNYKMRLLCRPGFDALL